jgi:hypothetical protein
MRYFDSHAHLSDDLLFFNQTDWIQEAIVGSVAHVEIGRASCRERV